jgi:hypothetical protein
LPSRSLLLAAALAAQALAGPVEFGMAEVQRALAARGLKTGAIRFNTEVSTDEPESFRILPGLVSGGDLRGLMYGLLEAASQIRDTGRLVMAKGTPATPVRGIRYALSDQDLQSDWPGLFAMLARNRFNRFHLVLAQRAGSLQRNLETLRTISQAASDHGIDLILGIPPGTADEVLRKAIGSCPAIRGLELGNDSSRDAAFRAIGHAGRRVTLDLQPGPLPAGIVEAARAAHVPLRISLRYWAGDLGRPYPAAETLAGSSALNLFEKPLQYECLWSLGSQWLLLWGDPDFVRRAVASFALPGPLGFEIDAPLQTKERGFDRHWLFYLLWGRLSYDPKTPDKVWMAELKRRFGAAAPDVLAAYQASSGVLGEIVAANLPNPNKFVWPEVDPGGLLDAYRDAPSGDGRYIAGIPEAVRNRLRGVASAKQTPAETADLLRERAAKVEATLARIQAKIPDSNREWRASEPDFQALALLARYHAHKLLALDQVAYFDQTGDPAALETARREIAAAVPVWEKLASIDTGPWGDKLPYVRQDLKLIEERGKIFEQFGRFDFGFDFGGAAPRFQHVGPATRFTEAAGFGWLGDGLHGRGPQTFRIRAADGVYSVFILHPDGTAASQKLRARNGFLDVVFPEGEFAASGLVVKGPRAPEPLPPQKWPKRLPRPNIAHSPPKTAPPDKPLALAVRISPPAAVKAVRLHYRPLNQLAKFKTLENAGAKGTFTIPAVDVSPRWDLMYYFEILNRENTGWFDPDPRVATPYYVVRIEP